jgi:DNA-directed RNA polymerase alpha subunit
MAYVPNKMDRFIERSVADINERAWEQANILWQRGLTDKALRTLIKARTAKRKAAVLCRDDPRNVPIQFCRFSQQLMDVLETHGYETMGDLLNSWPSRLLTLPGIGTEKHQAIWQVLSELGLLE